MTCLRWTSSLLGASSILVAVAGCAAVPVAPTPTSSASPASTASSEPADVAADREACAAFTDVYTMVSNAHVDHDAGRMTAIEYQGWLSLATRDLARIPTRGEGAVSAAIATLQAFAPAVPQGAQGTTTIDTDGFRGAAELAAACQAVGAELVTDMFTGG